MNQIFTHPGQPEMQVEVILASRSTEPEAPVIYTVRMRYPRIIHSEMMTHRVFSRNARSSRAVPVSKMLEEVSDKPFVPWHWGKNQKGMQASEECNADVLFFDEDYAWSLSREEAWLSARDAAVLVSEALADARYHKQICNRLIEPFSWIDVLVTSTDWDNFLWLRDHEDAEPHIRDLAVLVKQALDAAEIQQLEHGQWHLPYVTRADRFWAANYSTGKKQALQLLLEISTARCCRISYAPFNQDKANIEDDLRVYEQLAGSSPIHASPLEHQAKPDKREDYCGYVQYGDAEVDHVEFSGWENSDLHGNFTGWIQHRKTVPGERYQAPTA